MKFVAFSLQKTLKLFYMIYLILKMTTRICLGLLISSSKISLKPLLQRIASQLPDVTFHFSRFIVSDISGDQNSLQQFQSKMIIPTARFLADADVDIIGWMGTPSSWLGFETDYVLC